MKSKINDKQDMKRDKHKMVGLYQTAMQKTSDEEGE
jgi:hypothetical protein